MNLIRPALFNKRIIAALSTRLDGVSPPPFGMNLSFRVGDGEENVRRNRERFFGGLGIALSELAIPRQVHSARVLRVSEPGSYSECDALMTNVPRVFLCVSFADCVPLFLYDPTADSIAAIHAGWRGTSAQISRNAVQKMVEAFGARPEQMLAFLGPAAGLCCYAVGEEVASAFESRFVRMDRGTQYVDLKAANLHQLLEEGIRYENVEVSPSCTICESHLFHSHRRDGVKSGRMMGVIGLTGLPLIR